MQNLLFGQQGAVPQAGILPKPQMVTNLAASTPQAKALSSAATPYNFPGLGGPMPAPQAPSGQQVISHTTTDSAGNTTKQTYAAPQQSGLVQPPTSTQPPISNVPTFPGLVGTVAQQGTQPSPVAQQATDQSKQAFAQSQDFISQLQKSRQNEAAALQEQANQPIPLGDITGRQQAIANYYAQQQQGLGAAGQAASNLYSPALSAATTGVGQQYGASQSAASLAQPQLGAFGQGYYSPLDTTGGAAAAGGGALNPINNISSIAQQVIAGQISPQQAYAMGGNVPNFQGALNAAIQQAQPGFNTASAQGQYDARQSNTTTAGTAVTNANAQAYAQNLNPYLQLQNTVQNVDQFGNLLLSTMQSGGINPSDLKYANTTIQNIRSQLSSQQQAQFDSTYAALKSRISGLLATGGAEIPTQITTDANKVLDGSLPLGSLNAVLSRISTEGQILLQNQANLVNKPLQVAGGSSAGKVGTQTSDYQKYLKSIGL